MKDIEVMACFRAVDLKNPHPDSVQDVCSECNAQIWVKPENKAIGMMLMCTQCALALAATAGDCQMFPASAARQRHAERN